MALDLKKSIKGLTFFTSKLFNFGSKINNGDQFAFDRRGAIQITDSEIRKKNGEIIKLRSIKDVGSGGNSMVISRPASGQSVDASRAMESYHGWVFACVNAIANEIANTDFRVYQIKPDGTHEEKAEHEIITFLDSVNDFQTGPEFKHIIAAHLELTGNAYILLEGVNSETDKPKSMHLLDPSHVKINLDKTSYPFKLLNYEFLIDSRKFNYKPYEIIQLKYPDPSNTFLGIGTVQALAEWIDNDNYATEFLKQFFSNGAQIGVTFETDMSSEEQLQELRDSFNEQHSGVKNAYKGIFLPKGVKKPTNDIKFNDIGLPNLSDTSRDKILAGFRVSKTILGTAESDTNRATAETADYVFAKRTIKPKMMLICSYLNEFLVPRFADDIYVTFVDPVPEDKAFRNTEMKNSVGSLPVITVDEARETFMGLGPIEGGDKLMAPNNFAAAGNAGASSATPPTETGKSKYLNREKIGYVPRTSGKKTQFSRNKKIRKEMGDGLVKKISEIVLSIKKKGLREMTKQQYDNVILKEKRDRTDAYAEEIKKELIILNEKQKKQVLKNLSHAIKSQKAVDPDELFNLDNWIGLTVDALNSIAFRLFGIESRLAMELIDQPGIDISNSPEVRSALNDALDLLATSYNQSTLDMLESKINQGLEDGLSIDGLSQLIQDVYDFKDQYAADRLALTESNRIANMAAKMSWEKSGVVKQVEWVTSQRDNVCEFCAEQEGKVIDIGDNFFDQGDSVDGADGGVMMADYSDIGGPPLHPNCHCGIRPVMGVPTEDSIKKVTEDEEADEALKELQNE